MSGTAHCPVLNGDTHHTHHPHADACCYCNCFCCTAVADLGEKAGQYSTDVAVCGLVLGLAAGAYYLLSQRHTEQEQESSKHQAAAAPLDAARTPEEVLQQK